MEKKDGLLFEKYHMHLRSDLHDYKVRMIIVTALKSLETEQLDFLDEKDIDYINRVRNEEHRQDMILGRFAAKEAVAGLMSVERNQIAIKKGIFNQPFVVGNCFSNAQVTVSHSANYGIAIAYPEDLIIGIDMEKKIEGEKLGGIKLSEYEKDMMEKLCIDRTLFWTVREALIKCLKVNIFFTAEMMELTDIKRNAKTVTGSFRHFKQYAFHAFLYTGRVVAIVYPAGMTLQVEERNRQQ